MLYQVALSDFSSFPALSSHINGVVQTLDRSMIRRTGRLLRSFVHICLFFDHFRSDQCTQYTQVLDPCFTPGQEEKSIYYEVRGHGEFSILVSYSFEVEYDSCLDVVMHALAVIVVVHGCWEFWTEPALLSLPLRGGEGGRYGVLRELPIDRKKSGGYALNGWFYGLGKAFASLSGGGWWIGAFFGAGTILTPAAGVVLEMSLRRETSIRRQLRWIRLFMILSGMQRRF